jgi:PAS domain S-box-containing protein
MDDLQRETEVAQVLLRLAPKIIEQLHEGIVIVDDHLDIRFVNGSAEFLFDYHRDQLIGQNINVLLPERFRQKHSEYTSHYVERPSPRTMGRGIALFGVNSKGREFPVEISLSPFKTILGTFVVAVVHAKEVEREL